MALSNHARIDKGLESLRKGLLPYVERELKSAYGEGWWAEGVESRLMGRVGQEAKAEGDYGSLDVQALLLVLWYNWNDVFQTQLGHTGRSYVSELREVRNKWAHQQAFTTPDAYRHLDTIGRLLEMISSPEAEEVRNSAQEMMRQNYERYTKQAVKLSAEESTKTDTKVGLKPWREVATPHRDVSAGRYTQAEFAADLAQIISDEADPEYGNPQEFFSRTYITEGLKNLLALALNRLSGNGGDPVVELQTNFGGGKTHALIALYHLVSGDPALGTLPGIEDVMQAANVKELPRANRAVLVGTKLNVSIGQKKPEGIVVSTMWGEMAYQLGGLEGYEIVARNDQDGTSPGSDTLKELFERFSPAIILIDEWIAFARNLYRERREENLLAGSFESNMTFAQTLTEAANRSQNALVVASIPASDNEIGGEGGMEALERIQNTFKRLETVWKPATAEESFSIVRRRLFDSISDYTARDAACRAFAEMYRNNRSEFPPECDSLDYERKLKEAYPIHPELFDRLYQDWSTLERFQRTRGVLKLMASVIHELWDNGDKSLLIMPGTLPLNSEVVRAKITSNLPDGWSPIMDADVDGASSKPFSIDQEKANLGRYSACRRVARTVFMGSAPSVAAQKVRGLEEVRIKLGCVQPGEVPATFGDALNRMGEHLTYLYSDGKRYWFDTRPSVNRMASDRAVQMKDEDLDEEILDRLRKERRRGDFGAVHVSPSTSADVTDEKEVRLVLLSPAHPHTSKRGAESPAEKEAANLLINRGSNPRIYRNTLLFLAPDQERLAELRQAVRQYLAWSSIENDMDSLNLDTNQKKQVSSSQDRWNGVVDSRISETFSWLLVPIQDSRPGSEIQWETSRLVRKDESLIDRASKKAVNEGHLIPQWSPANLKLELDRVLWKDENHLDLWTLWEDLCRYLYLPRLANEEVLLKTISQGLMSRDYFGYADRIDENERYLGLVFGSHRKSLNLDNSSVLVKPEEAIRQEEEDKRKQEGEERSRRQNEEDHKKDREHTKSRKETQDPIKPEAPKKRKFYGSVNLDPNRVGREAGKIAQEIIQHLTLEDGAKVTVTIEIEAEMPEGAKEQTIRTLTENCRVLEFNTFEFE